MTIRPSLTATLSNIPYLALLLFACTGLSSGETATTNGLDPEEALKTFEIHKDFEIQLVAAEPMVQDPVAIEIDELGRMWVVEMPGYPLNVGGSGRVKMLTDTNGDGQADSSTIFADKLVLPTGIMRWKNGIIVTDPPDVLYLEDSDGDGVADKREVLLTGFARSNPQHNMNKPIYGLDNWIYIANNNRIGTENFKEQFGDPGSDIVFPGRDEPRLGQNAESRSVRFRPDSFELESLSSDSQFGHTFDAWGHYFQNDNSHPGFHEVIARQYLDRKDDSGVREAMEYIPAYAPKTDVYPITKNPLHQLLTDRGVFTSAAGITYYTGGEFGQEYEDLLFIAEPVHNLVHVDRVQPNGATYSSTRLLDKTEFLASTDSWFRPVNFYVGPDGAMYVVDYYRRIVEHPEWMDDETAKSGKLADGTKQGRIYRIVPKDKVTPSWADDFESKAGSTAELVSLLNHTNSWWRLNAQKKIVENESEELTTSLKSFLASEANSLGRVHALWILETLGQLENSEIAKALADKSSGVQENAIKIAERRLKASPVLLNPLMESYSGDDPNGLHARKNFQLLLTLGSIDEDQSNRLAKTILSQYKNDKWFLAAARTARSTKVFPGLGEILALNNPGVEESNAGLISIIAENLVRDNARSDLSILMDAFLKGGEESPHWWKEAVLGGILEGIRATNNKGAISPGQLGQLVRLAINEEREETSELVSQILARLKTTDVDQGVVSLAKSSIDSDEVTSLQKAQVLHVLGSYSAMEGQELALSCINVNDDPVLQGAAMEVLSRSKGLHQHIIDNWNTLSPSLRSKSISLFMNDDAGRLALLDEIEAGRILPRMIGWNRRVVLMRDTQGAVKEKARALLAEDDSESYTENMKEAETLTGSKDAGSLVFTQICSVCHQMAGENGYVFGPDLSTIRHWPVHHLLQGIANPNKSIADGYEFWLVKKTDGETLTGVIAMEDSKAFTLRMQGGAEIEIARQDVESIEAVGASAMPQGLADPLSAQELADLVAYIKG